MVACMSVHTTRAKVKLSHTRVLLVRLESLVRTHELRQSWTASPVTEDSTVHILGYRSALLALPVSAGKDCIARLQSTAH
jgi:hypothetical protein